MHMRDFTRHSLAAFVKGIQRPNLGVLVILLLASVLPKTRATGMFEVRFLDYTNPGNRNGQKTCCSGVETGGSCSSPCSTFFRVCLRPLTHTGSSCPFGQETSDVLGSGSFVIPSNSLLQIPWPNTLQSWPGSFSLLVEARHRQGPNSSILIEQGVVTRQSLLPGPQWHNRSHVGVVANITFSYRVKCQQNYYGDSCTTLCIPRDDHLGHYSCDSDGSKVCNPGWSGSYCDTAVCPGCDLNHATCSRPNLCSCQSGWLGQNCTECERYPGCLHGTCNKPWECNCIKGWGGKSCDLDLELCAREQPCKNGGTCSNSGPSLYRCTCRKGYTGSNCDAEIDECSSNPCYNGGTCTDLIGDFNCSCPDGYSGKQCYPDCVPGACKNGGTCVNGIRGYSCVCSSGFTGSACERAITTTPAPTTSTSPKTKVKTTPKNTGETTFQTAQETTPESVTAITRESTTNTSLNGTTTEPQGNGTMGEPFNSESGKGVIDRTTMIIVIVASVLVFLALFVGCVAWRFWRKRRRASQNATGQVEGVHSHANPKHIDIEDPDPKHRTGTKSGNPEIIRNFVASKRNEKNTNKTQDITAEEKLPEGTKSKEIARGSLELSDITTTTTTARSSTRERPTLDELYLPNRCFDQGYWQEVELEI